MTQALSPLSLLYFEGRRIRLTPRGAVKLRVPVTVIYGMVLDLIALPGRKPRVFAEFETPEGGFVTGLYDPEDLEPLPFDETELRRDLLGRSVCFPRGSVIGIAFPEGAADRGVITGVHRTGGKTTLVVRVSCEDAVSDAPFVTPMDFTQCWLVVKDAKVGTG